MIFVCVGSREYQFDRLLKEIDRLVKNNEIEDEIFAQIGQSTYKPEHYTYKEFLSVGEFKSWQEKADLIISHGGTGALIGALKLGKQVIAVPRLEKYGEHIDDHQTEVAGMLAEENYLVYESEIKNLKKAIDNIKKNPIKNRYDKPSQVIHIIQDFINQS
ncbi:PssE/Cps14G family polysaccharide biosynthesis glycosyltransferase [Oceanobacillus alkalisoli]|uniref:PssE/Cps14G family polysaccharide biosynthesis glycosyltransferase n=1 Tax=Oceanobacillus alkalisoli TaxID=2925113 RepID=UPI001EE3FB40|nr:PssE/Cps14G family polysaccharide biosynthesis glycosyltransferase [Oceanobacillus alkalisoli]MCG5102606.1 beta(1,3)galactosyltransferase EpsH [Oceanobacillus alkalisoli]